MARFQLHRKENGRWIDVATAVLYIKDGGAWRSATKAEADVFEVQVDGTLRIPGADPVTISVDIPKRDEGEDGDYYALLYPAGWVGRVWLEEP